MGDGRGCRAGWLSGGDGMAAAEGAAWWAGVGRLYVKPCSVSLSVSLSLSLSSFLSLSLCAVLYRPMNDSAYDVAVDADQPGVNLTTCSATGS